MRKWKYGGVVQGRGAEALGGEGNRSGALGSQRVQHVHSGEGNGEE
jgi:hypothetical protein